MKFTGGLSNPGRWNIIFQRYCISYDYTIEAKFGVRFVFEMLVHTEGIRFRLAAFAETMSKQIEFFNIRLHIEN